MDCAMTRDAAAALPAPWAPLAEAAKKGPLLVVAEGSSRLVPLGLATRLCRAWGVAGVAGCTGRQVPARWPGAIVALSNSGRTREVIEGLRGRPHLAVTGLAGGPLAVSATAALAVLPRPELAVAATASVVGQALVVAEALAAAHGQQLDRAGLIAGLGAIAEPSVPAVERLWIVGGDDGVAEELALKAWETAGLPATPVASGLALHGLEEVLRPGDAVWVIDCDDADRAPIRSRLAPTGATVIELSVPDCGGLTPLLRLATGWRWLAAWAVQRGRDPAKPKRARKVGNDIAGA
jgi:fructoselysine-6-P-deglycase FrlB-like protein